MACSDFDTSGGQCDKYICNEEPKIKLLFLSFVSEKSLGNVQCIFLVRFRSLDLRGIVQGSMVWKGAEVCGKMEFFRIPKAEGRLHETVHLPYL